jgi:SET domain-containing protein
MTQTSRAVRPGTGDSNEVLPFEVRRSPIHGDGVFATRDLLKGEVIGEYSGERITHAEANERWRDRDPADNHTFLFTLSSRTVIDGGVGGNGLRFLNHRCEPNCEPQIKRGRLFIVALKRIRSGDELAIEYNIGREDDDVPNVDEIYACHCRSRRCRGTMLWPARRRRTKR